MVSPGPTTSSAGDGGTAATTPSGEQPDAWAFPGPWAAEAPGHAAATRVLRVQAALGKAALEAAEVSQLLEATCRIAVEVGGYRLAWIGRVEQAPHKPVRPVAQAGYEEGYLETLDITWDDTPRGQGPTGRAVREKAIQVAQRITTDPAFEPWREEATRRGYAASAAIPITVGGEVELVLCLYAEREEAFDDEELALVDELGSDLAQAVVAVRERAELERVQAEARRWKRAFEHAGWGMAISSPDGDRIELANPAFARMHGSALEEIQGSPIRDLFPPEEHDKLQEAIARAAQQGHHTFESWHLGKDGATFPVQVDLTVVRDDQGEPLYRVANVQDISHRLEDRRTLEERAAALARTNAELERSAYVASHDLKEPVRTIHSFAQLLDRRFGDELAPQAREYLDYVVQGADRLSCLIKDLLEYVDAERHGGPMEPVDLAELLEEAEVSLREMIVSSGAVIEHDPLPTVVADRSQLGTALEHLLSNAIRYSGQGPPLVRLRADRQDGGWHLRIEDQGIGIEPRYHEHVFEPFRRLHPQQDIPGTGVGLSIVKHVVERHGGQVWVESDGQRGTTIHLTLPDDAPSRR